MQRNSWLVGIVAFTTVAACLDFGKFEGAAASSVASTAAASGGSAGMASSSSVGAAGGGTLPTCETQYGDATGYAPCVENALVCEFRASIATMSCEDICSTRGGECLDVYDPQPNCDHGGQADCTLVGNQTMICVCSRGCGGDPPCESPDVCANSICG